MHKVYDYIIVGAGVAGCVLATRLTAQAKTVLLIEAGKDTLPGQEPADILDSYPTSYYNKSYTWPGLKAAWKKIDQGTGNFPQGRVMGGGGSVMGMVSLRGTPEDYSEWVKQGAIGWSWEDVLPFYCKLEHDLNFQNAWHGQTGPIPIRRLERAQWQPLTKAISAYAGSIDMPYIADMNGDFRDGFGSVPMCNTPTRRASTALCYLTAQVRTRSNLTMVHEALVEHIIFEGSKAVGVHVKTKTGLEDYYGAEIIISGGGIFSPSLLMRSGIGDAQLLQQLQIPVLVNRKGVGRNLQNHPILFIGFHLKKHARQSLELRTHPSASIRYSSKLPGTVPGDLYINIQSKTSWNAMGQQIGNLAPCLLRPKSVGHVKIKSSQAEITPEIEFNFLSEEIDLQRMMMVFTQAVHILEDPSVKALCGTPFPVRFSDRLRLLNEYTPQNARKANALATLLNLLPGVSDFVLSTLTGDRLDLSALVKNPQDLAEHVQSNIAGMFHPVGSCRMGFESDPGAVVDNQCRVYGVQNLRVIDASVMPNLMAGNTNIPTIMVAEKMADALLNSLA